MEQEITPEQKAYLATFAGQRDAALLEISNLQTVKERLEKTNKELAASSTDIHNQVQQAMGRLAELDKTEKEYDSIVSGSLMENMIKKTRLEGNVTSLEKTVKILSDQKDSLLKDTYLLTEVFNVVNNRVGVLDKVVDHVVKVSQQNEDEISRIVSNLKASLKGLVDINQKNVTETNQVLDKLPRMLVELQRTKLIRNKI